MKRKLTLLLILGFIISSCVPGGGSGGSRKSSSSLTDDLSTVVDDTTETTGTTTGDDSTDDTTDTTDDANVVIDGIVNPYKKNVTSKITIPINYRGFLYLTGINFSQLAGRPLVARITWGRSGAYTEVPAMISSGGVSGVVQGSASERNLLVLDLSQSPLKNKDNFLPYRLFDYNEYGLGQIPTTNPFDEGLFCRGLNIEHDPTFTPASSTSTCSNLTDTCMYAYANIEDISAKNADDSYVYPTKKQMAYKSTLMTGDNGDSALMLEKCAINGNDQTLLYGSNPTLSDDGQDPHPADGTKFFVGPFLRINSNDWQISSDAIAGEKGIFYGYSQAGNPDTGYGAKLFPIAGQYDDLPDEYQYLGWRYDSATNMDPSKGAVTREVLNDNASTQIVVDGCNIRVATKDYYGNEIGSCNVSATIQLGEGVGASFERIDDLITKDIKIQIVRETDDQDIDRTEGTLTTSPMKFSTCETPSDDNGILNSTCAQGECCLNGRCRDSDSAACGEETIVNGNIDNGESCSADSECKSLCCSNGQCKPHNPDNPTANAYCNKEINELCLIDEFCRKVQVNTYRLILTTDGGGLDCIKAPTTYERHAQCGLGSGGSLRCQQPPDEDPFPDFDEDDPNKDCSRAEAM